LYIFKAHVNSIREKLKVDIKNYIRCIIMCMRRIYKRARDTLSKLKEARNGFISAYRGEKGFRKIIKTSMVLVILALLLPVIATKKIILILSLVIPIMAELTNSAIERAVDVATSKYNKNAREAKDISSAVVYISIFFTSLIWIVVIFIV